MNFVLPDGTQIEMGMGDNLPPGHKGGQHVSRSYTWYRINDGEWVPTNHRSQHRFVEWVECCETLADFMEGESQ